MKPFLFFILLLLSWHVHGQKITLLAGGGSGVDGTPAISATVFDINGVVVDKIGNIYFVESLGCKVRKIDTNGIVTTIAGTGSSGFSGDSGLAVLAQVNYPSGIAIDSIGNVYFTDNYNYRVRKITVSTGIITTVAGIGIPGFAGDSGLAINATLNTPTSLCFDKFSNMFIGDNANKRVRKVNTSGIITTYAGNGLVGWGGDGGLATAARCNPFAGMCTDAMGNLYVVESGNYVVRKISTTGIISTIAGDTSSFNYNGDNILATSAVLAPFGIAFDDSGLLYISDYNNNRLRKIDALGIIHTIAGTGIGGFSGDGGPADSAELNFPSGIAFDNCGNLIIGQVNDPRIRKITFDTSCHIHAAQTTPIDTIKTAVNNVIGTNSIKIYPNPATDVLHVETQEGMSYRLMNIVGAVAQQGVLKAGSNTVNVARLISGMYVLEMSNENGRVVRRVLKQ